MNLGDIVLNLNGIPGVRPVPNGELGFLLTPDGAWQPNIGNFADEIELNCVKIHDLLAVKIFGSISVYYSHLESVHEIHCYAGLNSESRVNKTLFETCLTKVSNSEIDHMLLYLYDCRKLVAGIQEGTKEVLYLMGEFYRSLNLDELFPQSSSDPDGLRYVTSPNVTKIHSFLGFIFIRLHSLLDYSTKLIFEVERMRISFIDYPNMTSKDVQFGDRKRLSVNNLKGSLFEKCASITEIEAARNLIIHDGLLDDMPKVYRVIENGKVVEKYILFPDVNESGRFERSRNRNLFFSLDDKINQRLPAIIEEFHRRQIVTLVAVNEILAR